MYPTKDPATPQEWLQQIAYAGRAHGYRQQDAHLHNALNLACLIALVAAGAFTLSQAGRWPLVAYVLVGGAFLGWIGFAVVILVVHEASHGMFLLARDDVRRQHLNRTFGRLVALPFAFDYIKHWEQGHTEHHRRPLEPHDPQQFNTLTGPALARRLAFYLLVPGGMFVHRFLGPRSRQGRISSGGSMRWTLLFWSVVLVPLCWNSGPAPALAVLFGLQVSAALNEIKGSLEHGGSLRTEADPRLRARSTLFPGRSLLMPFNISLHFEHHLNPSVPWYRLSRYHLATRELVPAGMRPLLLRRAPWQQLRGAMPAPSEAGT